MSEERARTQAQAHDQANGPLYLEFENRVNPVLEDLRAYRNDLVNAGDEAGAAHTTHCLDIVTSRFRIPAGDVATTADEEEAVEVAEPSEEEQEKEQIEAAKPQEPEEQRYPEEEHRAPANVDEPVEEE